MIEFYSQKGETYIFDPENERIYKDGVLLPSYEIEPVYSSEGEFVGVHYKGAQSIISKNGKQINLTSEAEI